MQPSLRANLIDRPWHLIFPLLAITGLVAIRVLLLRTDERGPFFASCAYLAGMFLSVVAGVYPMVLPSQNPAYSLTISNTKAGAYGLRIGLIWWLVGIFLTAGYFVLVYRLFGGKVASGGEAHGHSR